MKPQRGLLGFITRYPLAAAGAAAGMFLFGLGYAQQVYELWHADIKPWHLHATGAALFALFVLRIIYQWDQGRVIGEPSAAEGPGAVHNITSHNQSGGITAHTVNVGRRRRTLSNSSANEFKRCVLTSLSRDVEWDVVSILGDQEAFALAAEIHQFMRANGFKMQNASAEQAVFTGSVEGILIEQNGKIIVGTNVDASR